MGRQNGKTELGAVLALWGLMRAPGSITLGLASSKEQSDLVYKRAVLAIESVPSLREHFARVTTSRGVETKAGAVYQKSAADSKALQGVPVHTALVDELHLLPPELWADVVNGTGGRPNTFVAGLTTAGSEASKLLKQLYVTGEKAAAGDASLERFGFFRWEAPEARVPDDDATLLKWLKAANPALASGRLDGETVLADVRALGSAEIIRYRLNRFVASTDSFIDLARWAECQSPIGTEWPDGQPVFAIDWTHKQGYATIAAAVRDSEGIVHTRIVRWITSPTLEGLLRDCEHLAWKSPQAFVVGATLRELGNELKRRGYPVTQYGVGDMARASNSFLARTYRGTLRHAGDPILTVQLPRTVRKPVGDEYRISREESSSEIDAVIATVMAVHQVDVPSDSAIQVF